MNNEDFDDGFLTDYIPKKNLLVYTNYRYVNMIGAIFGASLTPKDARWIDQKYDDGNPIKGLYFGSNSGNESYSTFSPNCLSSNQYDISNSVVSCRLIALMEP